MHSVALRSAMCALLLVMVCQASLAQQVRVRCGVVTPPAETLDVVRDQLIDRQVASQRFTALHRFNAARRISIPVHFHILTSGNLGHVRDTQIDAQLEVLNSAFGAFGFQFEERARTRVDNADWFVLDPNTNAERNAKAALGRDTASSLNFYVADLTSLAGYARWPWDLAQYPQLDGVVIWTGALPNSQGGADEYNPIGLGMTAVHEVGHWLGLLHTFDSIDPENISGCFPGDDVGDTPAAAREYFGPGDLDTVCPVNGIDTCPQMPGYDPIDNYMDYSDDRCMTHFTVGQVERMLAMTREYRPQLFRRSNLLEFFDGLSAPLP